MKQKLLALRTLSNRRFAAAAVVGLFAAPAFADAGTGGTDVGTVLSNVLPTIINSVITGMSTTISQVAPVIALALGIGYAIKMVRKQAK